MHNRQMRVVADTWIDVVTPREAFRGKLRNVSERGLSFAGELALKKGQRVGLRFGTHNIVGVVSWSRAGNCGVRLDRALSPEQMAWARGVGLQSNHGSGGDWAATTGRFTEL